MKMSGADTRLGLGFIGFCLLLLLYLIPEHVGSLTESAALMPVLVTLFILILSIVLTVQGILSSYRESKTVNHDVHSEDREKSPPYKSMAGVVVIMIGYALLLGQTGFLITSAGAMVLLFLVFGIRDWLPIVLITILTLGILYISFEKLLGSPLPVGELFEFWMD